MHTSAVKQVDPGVNVLERVTTGGWCWNVVTVALPGGGTLVYSASWLDEKTSMPLKGEYYAASGKLLRSATFSDVKDFHGFKRPSRISMRNELATKRFSELAFVDYNLKVDPPPTKFVLDDLGR